MKITSEEMQYTDGEIITNTTAERYLSDEGIIYEDELSELNVDKEAISLLNNKIVNQYILLPYKIKNNTLMIMTVMENMRKQRDLHEAICTYLKSQGNNFSVVLKYTNADLRKLISQYYILDASQKKSISNEVTRDQSATKKKVISMIHQGIDMEAADIHLLPSEQGVVVSFRIQGKLVKIDDFKFSIEESQILANVVKGLDTSHQIDVTNSRMPGQGSFSLTHNDLLVNVRISTLPLASGFEKLDMRLLVRRADKRTLAELGYLQKDLEVMRNVNKVCSNGLFITAGPTGSGKTTALYGQLYEEVQRNDGLLNVITIENPVEISEPSFSQVQERPAPGNPELDLRGSKILDTILRQDPDIVLYGEIRNAEDAAVAIKVGETGHKVYTTIHANDCTTTILRLLDLGVSRSSLLFQLAMIQSQRLLGILCPHCSEPYELTAADKILVTPKEYQLFQAGELRKRGNLEQRQKCTHCHGVGYIKRIPLLEYIIFTDELRDIFMDSNTKSEDIAKILKKYKFKSMWEKAIPYIASGHIELSEALGSVGNKTAINNIITNML